MKNAIVIHGTEGSPEKNWFPWLSNELAKIDYNVFVPQFPSPPKIPAKIAEWFEVFKNYEQYLNENTILIGHSLGGIFILRILEKLKRPIKAAFFVATPIGVRPILNYNRDNAFSGFSFDWINITTKASHFEVFQSDNDPYVSLENGTQLAKQLNTKLTLITKAGHFNSKAGYTKFEVLFEKIKTIS